MYDFESSSRSDTQDHGPEAYSQELLSNIEDRDITAREGINIKKLQQKLRDQVSKNEEDINLNGEKFSLFVKSEKNEWESEINRATSVDELRDVQKKIGAEREKVKNLTKEYVTTMEQNSDAFTKDSKRSLDTIKQYLADFMKLDSQGKAKRMGDLENDIKERYKIIEEILKIDPSMKPHLETMRRSEREKKLKELKKLTDGVEKGIEPHKKLIAEFKAFPSQFRSMSEPEFTTLTLEEKQKQKEKMVKKLEEAYKKRMESCTSEKAFSKEESKMSEGYFFNKETPLTGPYGKIKAYEMLNKQAKDALAIVKKFKGEIGEFPPEEKAKATELENEFYNAGYEKKEELVKKLETDVEGMHAEYYEQYVGELQKYIGTDGKGIISQKTARDFGIWFRLQPLKNKPRFIKELAGEIKNQGYEETLKEFNKAVTLLSSEKANLYQSRFFNPEIGGSGRRQILAQLLAQEKIAKNTLTEMPEVEASATAEGTSTPVPSEKTAETQENPSLENASDEELARIIKQGRDAEAIKEKREMQTSLDELAEAAKTSELLNQGQKDAEKRIHGLSHDEIELQEQMARDSKNNGKKMVLGKNHATGEIEAQKVITVNIDKGIDELTPEQKRELKIAGTRVQRTSEEGLAQEGARIEYKNEAGETVTADSGMKKTAEKNEKTAEVIAMNIARKEREKGRSVSEKTKTRLTKIAQKKELMHVRLEAQEERAAA